MTYVRCSLESAVRSTFLQGLVVRYWFSKPALQSSQQSPALVLPTRSEHLLFEFRVLQVTSALGQRGSSPSTLLNAHQIAEAAWFQPTVYIWTYIKDLPPEAYSLGVRGAVSSSQWGARQGGPQWPGTELIERGEEERWLAGRA
jgi:hypothetical protein